MDGSHLLAARVRVNGVITLRTWKRQNWGYTNSVHRIWKGLIWSFINRTKVYRWPSPSMLSSRRQRRWGLARSSERCCINPINIGVSSHYCGIQVCVYSQSFVSNLQCAQGEWLDRCIQYHSWKICISLVSMSRPYRIKAFKVVVHGR